MSKKQSRGRDSRVPARSPGQGLQVPCTSLYTQPSPVTQEACKYPPSVLQFETLITNAAPPFRSKGNPVLSHR